jgi:hypothetical protein
MLVGFGDTKQATGDLRGACHAWRQALQILDDLRLPDNHGLRARLEQVDPSR